MKSHIFSQLLPVYQSRGGVSSEKLISYTSAVFNAAKVQQRHVQTSYSLFYLVKWELSLRVCTVDVNCPLYRG